MQLTPTHRSPNSTRKGDLVLQPLLITGPYCSLHPNTHLQDSTSSYSPILLKIPQNGATSSPISTTTQSRLSLHKCGLPSRTARLPDPRYLPFIPRWDEAVMCNRWSSVLGSTCTSRTILCCCFCEDESAGQEWHAKNMSWCVRWRICWMQEVIREWRHHWFLPWIPGMLSWEVLLFFCCSLVMTPIEICGDQDGRAMHASPFVCMHVCMYVCGPWCGHFSSSNSTTIFGIGSIRLAIFSSG